MIDAVLRRDEKEGPEGRKENATLKLLFGTSTAVTLQITDTPSKLKEARIIKESYDQVHVSLLLVRQTDSYSKVAR